MYYSDLLEEIQDKFLMDDYEIEYLRSQLPCIEIEDLTQEEIDALDLD